MFQMMEEKMSVDVLIGAVDSRVAQVCSDLRREYCLDSICPLYEKYLDYYASLRASEPRQNDAWYKDKAINMLRDHYKIQHKLREVVDKSG